MRAWIEIDRAAIRTNVGILNNRLNNFSTSNDLAQHRLPPERISANKHSVCRHIMAIVKADGYGHGLLPAAVAFLEAGVSWLGIATIEEGIALREAGVKAPIALLCPFVPEQAPELLAHALIPIVGDSTSLAAIVDAARQIPGHRPEIHLDIDTGIGRSGVLPDHAVAFWHEATQAGVAVTGLTTHFSDADNSDTSLSREQEMLFSRALDAVRQAGAQPKWIHTSNSPATVRDYCPFTNLVRPGLLLYGVSPFGLSDPPNTDSLIPALMLKSRVGTVRELPEGHPISYGATVRLRRRSRVATILIGYGDGYPRRLSNAGEMLIRGQRAPILGRVCMDQTVVDVTDIPTASAGDEVVCIGRQGSGHISVEELATIIDTTPHEITCGLTPRLLRRYLP